MLYRVLADFVVVGHGAFILFSLLGGLLALKWKHWMWIHIPAFLWVALIEFGGWICPLAPLENWLREKGGGESYRTGFVEHYLVPLIYPGELTRSLEITLGLTVLVINLGIYGWILRRSSKQSFREKVIKS